MRFQDNDFLLFTGDSVTDAGRGRPVGEGLGEGVGTGYVRAVDTLMNAFFPDLRLRISNTGTSGNTVRDLAERWQSDVLDLKPDWLSVCIGINDVWRQYDMPNVTHRHVYPEEYRQTLEDLVCRTRQKVKGIVLMTPYYMEPCKEDWMRARMDEYGAIVRQIAEKYDTGFVDLQAIFDNYLQHRHSSFLTWDRVHPNPTASMLIAKAFLKLFDIEVDVSMHG